MENVKKVSDEVGIAGQVTPPNQLQQAAQEGAKGVILKKLIGGFLVVIGFLLSPLCWWNDLFFNLPIAYFFGYMCSWFSQDLLIPCSILGYWISNIVGILLMQAGALDVFQGQPKERNLKKELLTGLASSTVYTIVILALIQFKILDVPVLFSGS
ncbi:MAG: hypothetical protein ICV78_27010 [Tolypothrix sp. Co-bin9]|nr:hypothetical protein [Tolypothrix sp. Co-bin9]